MGTLLDQQPQDASQLVRFHQLASGLVTSPPLAPEDAGPAAAVTADTSAVFGQAAAMAKTGGSGSGAQGLPNPFQALWSGGKEVLRSMSYYEMKNRAGVIGQSGLGPLLASLAPAGSAAAGAPDGAQLRRAPGLVRADRPARHGGRRRQPGQEPVPHPGRVLALLLRPPDAVLGRRGRRAGGRARPGRRAAAVHVHRRRPGRGLVVPGRQHAGPPGRAVADRPGLPVGRHGTRRVPAVAGRR